MSDKEADPSLEDPSEEAIMALAIAQADELVRDRLAECGADPDTTFTFKWLYNHTEVLWLCHRLNVDFDLHMNKMFKPVTVLPTLVIDPDHMIELQMENAQHWIWADDQYLHHQALLLRQVWNQLGIEPPGEPNMIFCCVVVWVCHDQATVTVPQALEHLTTVVPQDTVNLTLCKIPIDAPFWPSPPSDDESYLITLSGKDTTSLFGGPPQALCAYRGITYHRTSSFRTFMALNKSVSRKVDIQSDEAAFYYIKPRKVLWVNDLYVTVSENNQNIPAINTLYLVGPDSILLNLVLELKPTIASAVTATFEDEPTANAQTVEVAECIIMVGKKQFDMTMGGDQESDSASSLTVAITNIKIEPPNQGTIMEDMGYASQLPEGSEDAMDMTTLGPITDEEETPFANDSAPAMVPTTAGDPNTQTTQPKPADVQVNPDHVNYLLNPPCAPTDKSLILDDVYAAIMDTFFLHIWVRHAESLGDLNTCRAAVNKAIQTWTNAVSRQTGSLRSFPGLSS